MLAVVETGGKQYRVAPEQIVYVELTGEEVGKEITLDKVLLVQNGSDVKVGTPYVQGASIKAKVLSEAKGDKIQGYKYKKRKKYARSWGHRQRYHQLQIVSISS